MRQKVQEEKKLKVKQDYHYKLPLELATDETLIRIPVDDGFSQFVNWTASVDGKYTFESSEHDRLLNLGTLDQ